MRDLSMVRRTALELLLYAKKSFALVHSASRASRARPAAVGTQFCGYWWGASCLAAACQCSVLSLQHSVLCGFVRTCLRPVARWPDSINEGRSGFSLWRNRRPLHLRRNVVFLPTDCFKSPSADCRSPPSPREALLWACRSRTLFGDSLPV